MSFVWCEVLLQLPFFFVAAYAYAAGAAGARAAAGLQQGRLRAVAASRARPAMAGAGGGQCGCTQAGALLAWHSSIHSNTQVSHTRTRRAGKSWIRIPVIMYGVHAATTVIPMLAEFQASDNPQKASLLAMYGAYAAIPMLLALNMAASQVPFPAARKKKTA